MKYTLIYILPTLILLGGCKSDPEVPEPPGPPEPPEVITELPAIEQYPGLILQPDMYETYRQRFEALPADSPGKKNKIVRAMFSDSDSDKQTATNEFISYWKNYSQRWTQEALDRDQPDGVSMRGIWRTIHLYDIVKSFGMLKTGEENEFRSAVMQAVKWAVGNDSKNPRIPEENWRMSNIYTDVFLAAGMAGLTFWDQPQSVDWVNHAVSELKWQLDNCVWDGAWHETPRYHLYSMKLIGQFMEVLHNRTGVNLFEHKANKELAEWLIRFSTPFDKVAGANAATNGAVMMSTGIGDAAWGENMAVVNHFAGRYRNSAPELSRQLMWLWDNCGYLFSEEPVLDLLIDNTLTSSAPAKPGSDISEGRGYVMMRDGYGTDDQIWFMLKCGATSMHDHGDKNSFSLTAFGTPLALDSGTGDYDDPSHRAWNKKAISHNTVVFREKGVTDITKYYDQAARDGKILHWDFNDRIDYSVTDASHPANVMEYIREVVFVRPDYFVIRDRVRSGVNKESVWMLQTPCDDIRWEDHSILCKNDWGTALDIHVVAPSGKLEKIESQGRFGTWTDAKPNANAGLYPFKYQTTLQVPGPQDGQFVTVLHPMKDGMARLEVSSTDGGNTVEVKCGSRQDKIVFTAKGVTVTVGGNTVTSEIN